MIVLGDPDQSAVAGQNTNAGSQTKSRVDTRAAYLDPAVKVEPLVDRWYAWPHLLAPAQQALNLLFRYLPAVRSFVAAPGVHVAASKDPAMFGGPFLALPATDLGLAKAYIATIGQRRAEALEWARAFRDFDIKLQNANGFSLAEYRETMPSVLRGRMELVYDLNNHPKIRILEEMFEEYDLGHRQAQEVLLHREVDMERPFFLSTPRLRADGGLFIRGAFNEGSIQMLCSARDRPIDLEDLAKQIGAPTEDLAPYFLSEPPAKPEKYLGDGVRVRYFGHACLLIESDEVSILVDPTAARNKLEGVDHFTIYDLPPKIDYLFISHVHQDHLSPEVLMQLRDRVGCVLVPPTNRGELADPCVRRMLEALGFRSIRTLETLRPVPLPGGAFTALPFSGEHADLDIHSKQCAVIDLKGRRICLFIDSDAIDPDVYDLISPRIDNADLMFIGMECVGAPLTWLYGPLVAGPVSQRNDSSRRLSGADSARGWRLVQALKPSHVLVYAMGQELWMRHLMGMQYTQESLQPKEAAAFVALCRAGGLPAEYLMEQREIEV